ncbi:MAG: di-trans,poly-cis-decaprenylcistransferase [Proteobacteria bacterium]|nr:di-trans,poly-cis-decaprenylcistransferase [Pseudomonadota bacterium]
MDGNGRWASRRLLNREAGHRAGAQAVDRIVRAAAAAGISTLTLYAFSSDNWHRPAREVQALLGLLRRHLLLQSDRCLAESIRVSVIGRRERLDAALIGAIDDCERTTSAGERMHLRIAIDYSSRRSLIEAGALTGPRAEPGEFLAALARIDHSPPSPEVDLLIRTGGEKRLSDFLLWECAYAELVFVDCLWPDFDNTEFTRALEEFGRRERRFGRVSPDVSGGLAGRGRLGADRPVAVGR